MSTAGVSRSGRVRKKSAKLIEMETEANPNGTNSSLNNNNIINNINTNNSNNNNNNNNRNSLKVTPIVSNVVLMNSEDVNSSHMPNEETIDETQTRTESVSAKPIKKLKIKLPSNPSPSPAIPSESSKPMDKSVKIDANCEPLADNTPKKATIPPLKIPKSKITGLVVPTVTPEVDSNVIQSAAELKSTPNALTSERKTKKLKNQKNSKTEIIEPKVEQKELNEIKAEVNESVPEVVVEIPPIVSEPSVVTTNERPIEETPKASKAVKPKKREHESAANRLFRQITSGVPMTPKTKGNKRNKSLPLEDVTQISFDDDFEETSLIIETEDVVKTKPKPKRSRPPTKTSSDSKGEKKTKRGKRETNDEKPKKKRNSVITAYMIWSKEHRSKIQHTCPDLDFADVSRKLGEIWQSMAEKDKIPWRRKAQKLVGKGSSIISTGKPKASTQSPKTNANSVTASGSSLSSPIHNDDYSYTSIDDLWQPIGTSPIDVSAHLTLLGESLSIIGQRLKEHSGQIAVSGSLSVLLDSTLCAIGPLLCLTQLDPNLNGCPQETHKKTLDNIAYIMPGI